MAHLIVTLFGAGWGGVVRVYGPKPSTPSANNLCTSSPEANKLDFNP